MKNQEIINLKQILGLKNDNGIFYDQGKTWPGQKEKDPWGYFIDKKTIERDFDGLIYMVDTTKMLNPINKAWWKTLCYAGLGVQDSVKHYGQFFLDQTGGQAGDNFTALVNAALGNKEKAIGTIQEAIKRLPASDKLEYCNIKRLESGILGTLGEYEEAIELLIKLNREYPEYGQYGVLFNDPLFDKIKRESPAFVEALNSLKLPPKLDLEGRSKF